MVMMVWILLSRGKIVAPESWKLSFRKDLRNEYPIQRKAREYPTCFSGVVLEPGVLRPGIRTGNPDDPPEAAPPEEDGVEGPPPLGLRLWGVAKITIAPS